MHISSKANNLILDVTPFLIGLRCIVFQLIDIILSCDRDVFNFFSWFTLVYMNIRIK